MDTQVLVVMAEVHSVLCLFEDARISKMTNIFRGCLDGLLGRTSAVD